VVIEATVVLTSELTAVEALVVSAVDTALEEDAVVEELLPQPAAPTIRLKSSTPPAYAGRRMGPIERDTDMASSCFDPPELNNRGICSIFRREGAISLYNFGEY
jgi:hypothetical protein